MESHRIKVVFDAQGGPPKNVFQRTPETEQAIRNHQLGEFWNTPPLYDRGFLEALPNHCGIFVGSYVVCRMALRTKLDKIIPARFRVLNGTQILGEYLRKEKQDFLEGFPEQPFVAIMYGFTEATNKRVPDLVRELVGNRYQKGKSTWVFFPQSLNLIAEQWGICLLDLNYLSTHTLPKMDGIAPLESSSGVNAEHEQRRPREYGDTHSSMTGTPGVNVTDENQKQTETVWIDRKLAGKNKDKKKWRKG